MGACKEMHTLCERVCEECCSFYSDTYIIQYTFLKLTNNNLSHLVYAWAPQRVGLNAAINTPTAVKTTPDTDTFSAAASTQSSYKWIYHLTCLTHVSTILDRIRTCPLHPLKLIVLLLSYVPSRRHDSSPPIVVVMWEKREQIGWRAALHVCANVTKRKVMQIVDLITSRPLLHPASNVSLAETFPACFSCTIIHLSTALKCLFCFTFFIPT